MFSPDGKLLAVADRDQLILWHWQKDKHERIDLGRRVGSLAFSPDGKYLAEGPAAGENLQVRDVETRKVAQALSTGANRPLTAPPMGYTQDGRVLITCDDRIHLWDTASGSIAHQIARPAGLPRGFAVTPNGRYLAVMIDDDTVRKLSVWRLDGEKLEADPEGPPAAAR